MRGSAGGSARARFASPGPPTTALSRATVGGPVGDGGFAAANASPAGFATAGGFADGSGIVAAGGLTGASGFAAATAVAAGSGFPKLGGMAAASVFPSAGATG